jgi:hypothetical protein
MERIVRCAQCQRANVSASDGHHCDECRRAWQSRCWRRFAEAMMRGLEPEADRTTLH